MTEELRGKSSAEKNVGDRRGREEEIREREYGSMGIIRRGSDGRVMSAGEVGRDCGQVTPGRLGEWRGRINKGKQGKIEVDLLRVGRGRSHVTPGRVVSVDLPSIAGRFGGITPISISSTSLTKIAVGCRHPHDSSRDIDFGGDMNERRTGS